MKGMKHLVQCRCILPTLKDKDDPPLHSFVVFSVIDPKNNTVFEKSVQCNNCGVVHRVYDLCKSTIVSNREDLKSALSIDDIKFTLPENVVKILENYDCGLPTYEHVKFMYDFNVRNDFTILTKEKNGDMVEGKVLRFKGRKNFSIEPFTSSDEIN